MTSPYEMNDLISRIVTYVEANLDKPLHIDRITAELGTSNYLLCLAVRDTFRQTPYQFVLEKRLQKAACLLTSSVLAIKAIGPECGLGHRPQFAKAFRKRFGMSPGAYRNLFQKA